MVHNDDTGMRVPMLKRDPSDDRTGVFTSGILSVDQGRKIALYFTGSRHAGENLTEVLKKRSAELPSPIQMCSHGLGRPPIDMKMYSISGGRMSSARSGPGSASHWMS